MKKMLLMVFMISSLFLLASCRDKVNNNNTFQVVFFTYKGDNSIKTIENVPMNSKIPQVEEPVRDGFEFLGWALDINGNTIIDLNEYLVTKSVTIFAIWLQGELSITYHLNGGAFVSGVDVPYAFEVGKTVFLPNATRTGYTFDGWYDKPAEEVAKGETPIRDTSKFTKSLELYAVWTAKRIRVTFKSEVSGVQLPQPSIQLIAFDSVIAFPDYTDKVAGYIFLGWFDASGKQYINGELFTRATDVTITAKFQAI